MFPSHAHVTVMEMERRRDLARLRLLQAATRASAERPVPVEPRRARSQAGRLLGMLGLRRRQQAHRPATVTGACISDVVALDGRLCC